MRRPGEVCEDHEDDSLGYSPCSATEREPCPCKAYRRAELFAQAADWFRQFFKKPMPVEQSKCIGCITEGPIACEECFDKMVHEAVLFEDESINYGLVLDSMARSGLV
jgi:hypothetical protein